MTDLFTHLLTTSQEGLENSLLHQAFEKYTGEGGNKILKSSLVLVHCRLEITTGKTVREIDSLNPREG